MQRKKLNFSAPPILSVNLKYPDDKILECLEDIHWQFVGRSIEPQKSNGIYQEQK